MSTQIKGKASLAPGAADAREFGFPSCTTQEVPSPPQDMLALLLTHCSRVLVVRNPLCLVSSPFGRIRLPATSAHKVCERLQLLNSIVVRHPQLFDNRIRVNCWTSLRLPSTSSAFSTSCTA